MVAGGCDVGVGAAARSSISAMWRSVMRDRDGGKRFGEMAAGVERKLLQGKKDLKKKKQPRGLKFFARARRRMSVRWEYGSAAARGMFSSGGVCLAAGRSCSAKGCCHAGCC